MYKYELSSCVDVSGENVNVLTGHAAAGYMGFVT